MIIGIVASTVNSNPWTPLASTTSMTGGAGQLTIIDGVVRMITGAIGASSLLQESRDNGVTFTPFSPSFPNGFDQYAVSSGFVVATGSSGLRIRRRVNDTSSAFQTITPDPFSNSLGTGVAFNGTYFATATIGNGIAAQVYSSTSGAAGTWVQRTVSTPAPANTTFVRPIEFVLGTFVIVGSLLPDYYALTSADGVSWQGGLLPSSTVRPVVSYTTTEIVFSVSSNTTDAYTTVPGSGTYTPVTLGTPAISIRPYEGKLYGLSYDRRNLVVGTTLETLQVVPGILPDNRTISSFDINTTTNEIWVASTQGITGGVIWKRPIPA